MKNIKCFFCSTKNWFFISFIIYTIITISLKPLNICDNCWELNSGIAITKGLIPYKDISFVSTPFYYYVIAFFCCMLPSFWGYKIAEIFLSLGYIFFASKIINLFELKTSYKILSYCIGLLPFLHCEKNYSWYINIFFLCTIYCTIKFYDTNKNIYLYIIGTNYAFAFLTKHTSALFVYFFFTFYLFKVLADKKCIKKFFIIIITPFLMLLFYSLYLIKNNAFNEFVDLSLKGIKDFSTHNNSYSFLSPVLTKDYIYCVLFVFFLLLYLFIGVFYIKKEKDFRLKTFAFFLLPTLIQIYPILNKAHIYVFLTPFSLFFVCFFFKNISYFAKKNTLFKSLCKFSTIDINENILYFCTTLFVLLNIIPTTIDMHKESNANYIQEGVFCNFVEGDYEEYISPYLSYEKEHQNEKYLSIECVFNSVCLAKNEIAPKYLSMYLYGNIGTKNPIDVILENNKLYNNPKWIIFKDSKIIDENLVIWQTIKEGRDYIKQNYKKIDSIGDIYDVYEIQ